MVTDLSNLSAASLLAIPEHSPERLFGGGGQLRAPQGTGQLRGQLAEFDQVRFARYVLADQVQQVLAQGGGPRGALQAAGNGDDTEGAVGRKHDPILVRPFHDVKWFYFTHP